jgi:agmatine deiminase
MAYPNTKSDNTGSLLENAQDEIISIANAIAEFEPVILLSSSETLGSVKPKVNQNVTVLCVEQTSHLWIRDFGPIFVKSRSGRSIHGVDFNFNYWGAKRPLSGDELIAEVASNYVTGGFNLRAGITAEGGAMEVDGEGTFMAAESAIINDNRNPGKTRGQIESELSRLLGVHKFLWLAGEAGKETTDCHIDALARFIRPGIVLLSKPSPRGSGKYAAAYTDAKTRLSRATDALGNKLVLHDCLEPDLGKLDNVSKGENCVASYVNFVAVNGGVIIPRFGDEDRDLQALRLFETLFPDRKVVQVYINALPHIGGGIHCATQQVPALT